MLQESIECTLFTPKPSVHHFLGLLPCSFQAMKTPGGLGAAQGSNEQLQLALSGTFFGSAYE